MELSEVSRKYQIAKTRFLHEIREIEEEYILSKYNFKKGDIVRFKNAFYKSTLIVVDEISFLQDKELLEPRWIMEKSVKIQGHIVDEDGFSVPYFVGGSQPIGVALEAKDVYEVTGIKYKNRIR